MAPLHARNMGARPVSSPEPASTIALITAATATKTASRAFNHSPFTTMDDTNIDSQEIALETPADHVFRAPSICTKEILHGASYAHYSAIPKTIADEMATECVLGVDEAGRGPVLGTAEPSSSKETDLYFAIC